MHAAVVEGIERLYAGRLTEQVERIAYHALRGEVWDKAVSYSRQAGAKADARSAFREAVSYFEQALTLLEHLPDGREMRELAIDLHFELRVSLGSLGELERVLEHLRAAEALANALGDERRSARVNVYIARFLLNRGEYEQAVTACERALARISHNGIISRAASAEDTFTSMIRGDQHYCQGDREAIGRRWQRFGFARANARFAGVAIPSLPIRQITRR